MSGYVWFDTVSGEHRPIPGRVAKVEMPVPDEFVVHRRPDRKTGWAVTHVETGFKAGGGKTKAEAIDTARRRIVYFGPEVFAKAVDAARLK